MKRQKEVNPMNIPSELRGVKCWLNWRYGTRSGNAKPTKVPLGKIYSRPWNTVDNLVGFFDAFRRDVKHLGFAFIESGFVGIDIDNAFDESGEIKPCVIEATNILPPTWGDISPSGKGFHLYLKGVKPEGMPCRFKLEDEVGFEVYDSNRFFTVTGNQILGTPLTVADENGSLLELWYKLGDVDGTKVRAGSNNKFERTLSESELRKLWLKRVETNDDLKKLWFEGEISKYKKDSSSADLALCNHLAFWMQGDAALIDKMFRRSALMRDKWDEFRGKSTYGDLTIDKALVGLAEIYDPSPEKIDKVLPRLLKRYIWIKRQEKFADIEDPLYALSRNAVRSSHLHEIKNADTAILGNKDRQEVLDFGFYPGQERIVSVEKYRLLNQWLRPSIQPAQGDVTPFLDALVHTYPDESAREVMIWFMAHTVVRPEIKIRWAPVIIGTVEGSGKSFWFDVALKHLVGIQHFRPVTESEFFGSFNEFLACSKLICFEEIWAPGRDGSKFVNQLKPIISNDSLSINKKYLNTYTIQNFVSCVFFSNHSDALAISAFDRRFFVYETPANAMENVRKGWGADLASWLFDENGLSNLLWYFENEVDLNAYSPSEHAPHTEDKERLQQLAAPSLDIWLMEAIGQNHPIGVLQSGEYSFAMFGSVASAWREQSGKMPNPGMLNAAFRRMGWKHYQRFKADSGGSWSPSGWANPALTEKLKPMSKRQSSKFILEMIKGSQDF